jgi:hypothetical protein
MLNSGVEHLGRKRIWGSQEKKEEIRKKTADDEGCFRILFGITLLKGIGKG